MASPSRADVHDEVEKEREERCENVHDANVAIIREAITAEQLERMGVLKALMVFPKATFWSFMVSFCIVSFTTSSFCSCTGACRALCCLRVTDRWL